MNFANLVRGYLGYLFHITRNCFPGPNAIRSNKKFKNIHQGQRCFILGSGPSILKQDLTKIAGEIVITQNHFHMHKDINTINPKYHCVVPMYQGPEHDKEWVKWLKYMEERLAKTSEFFFGINTKTLLNKNCLFEGKKNYVFPKLNPLYMNKAFIDITKRIMNVPTVITQCLTIALYMGFSEIYLVGFDMDQISRVREDENKVRFYGTSPITANKAEKEILKQNILHGTEWFNRWLTIKQLVLLRNLAEKRGIRIVNATFGGLLDCFERCDYDSIFN